MTVQVSEQEFGRLLHEHQGIIRKVCQVYAHTEADREDLFQEILIRLWQGLPSFRGEAKFTTWMYRVALNTAISLQRKRQRRLFFVPLPDAPLPAPAPESTDEKKTQRAALYCAIGQLKAVEKAIILLYLEEHSYEEIAEITGLSKSNVSVKLVRIKRKLEKLVRSNLKNHES